MWGPGGRDHRVDLVREAEEGERVGDLGCPATIAGEAEPAHTQGRMRMQWQIDVVVNPLHHGRGAASQIGGIDPLGRWGGEPWRRPPDLHEPEASLEQAGEEAKGHGAAGPPIVCSAIPAEQRHHPVGRARRVDGNESLGTLGYRWT